MSDEPISQACIVTFSPRLAAAPAATRAPEPVPQRVPTNTFVVGLLRQGYYNAVAYMNAVTARQS
ncbi:hypothetical protein ACLF3G_05640 [Falsiroseomonas sp. HC035]|uniref:hypothetical protein n=1 Tax=Falsiroseomonas sp. HC035 TaxID=3390999 RepID=UPI003D31D9F1